MHTAPLEDWRILIKRFFDVVFSIIVIILTLPIMAIVAVTIKFGDNGEILFTQQRVGYNKRIFKVYKFRTMCKDADKIQGQISQLNEMDGPVFKIKNDPRISPFGRFLRRYSLDELPQLFNVLKGDMDTSTVAFLRVSSHCTIRCDDHWKYAAASRVKAIAFPWGILSSNACALISSATTT